MAMTHFRDHLPEFLVWIDWGQATANMCTTPRCKRQRKKAKQHAAKGILDFVQWNTQVETQKQNINSVWKHYKRKNAKFFDFRLPSDRNLLQKKFWQNGNMYL